MVDREAAEVGPHLEERADNPGWRFWSTRDSIEHDIPSVSAVIETLLAVPAFWWLAGRVGFYLPLMISMMVAPLVLLRSDESVALGLCWFLKWHQRKGTFSVVNPAAPNDDWREQGSALALAAHLIIALGGGVLSVVATRSDLDRLLPPFRAPTWLGILLAVWLAVFIYDLAIVALSAFASLFIGRLSTTSLTARGRLTTTMYNVVLGGVIGWAVAAALSGAGATGESVAAIIGLFAGLLNVVIFALPYRAFGLPSRAMTILLVQQLFLALPGPLSYALFVFAETALIRIAATARHLPKGLEELPRNFRRLVICTSPAQVPELIPGLIPGKTPLRWFTLPDSLSAIARVRQDVGTLWAMQSLIGTALLFLPAWLYRITLKSTAWFWWPLTLLGGEVRHAQDPALHYERALKSLWGLTGIVLSLATLGAFLFTNLIDTGGIFQKNPLLNTIGYLFLINWSAPPWQLLSVLSAGLSLFIIVRLDYVFREYRYAKRYGRDDILSRTARKFFYIELAGRVRLLAVLAFWAIVGCHTFLYLNSLDCWVRTIPSALEAPARALYGNRLPPLTCIRPGAGLDKSAGGLVDTRRWRVG